MILRSILAAILLVLAACDDNSLSPDEQVLGTWVLAGYEDDLTVMRRSSRLLADEYGFVFFHDGRFTERKINGWCGTPPVVYENYSGQWESETATSLHITVGYWGGETAYRMEIVSITTNELSFRIIPSGD